VAAVFGIHPLQVESVAWVTERKTVLSGLFWVTTIMAYRRYVRSRESTISNQRVHARNGAAAAGSRLPLAWYGVALGLFAIGLMCKPVLVTVPVILLLLDFWPFRRFSPNRNAQRIKLLLIEKLPFFALGIVSTIVTILGHQGLRSLNHAQFPIDVRLENALVSCARYLGKAIWPHDLAVFYPHPGSWPASLLLLSVLVVVSVTVFAVFFGRRRPALLVGWLWFTIALLPMIGIIQAGVQAMADRFAYLPLIGLAVATVWLVSDCMGRVGRVCVVSVALAGFAGTTMIQTSYWQNSIVLWNHTLKVTRGNYVAHNNLAAALYRAGDRNAAEEHVLKSLAIKPTFVYARCLLGQIRSDQGRLAEAVSEFEAALTSVPEWIEPRLYLARTLSAEGRIAQAAAEYRRVLKLEPEFPLALNNLAWILATSADDKVRNGAEAERLARRACEVTKYEVGVYVGTLAAALAEIGQFEEAATTAERARRLALQAGDSARVERNAELANQFRSGRPYREPERAVNRVGQQGQSY
jgi:protein O-mannosyl-transferase